VTHSDQNPTDDIATAAAISADHGRRAVGLAGPVLRCIVCGGAGGYGLLRDLCERDWRRNNG